MFSDNNILQGIYVSRRNLLFSSAAIAAGATFLQEHVRAADNPAAAVEDRGANLKITSLKAATRVVGEQSVLAN